MTGNELREAIRRAGITQAAFGQLVGYHPASVGNMISTCGAEPIPARAAAKFAKVLAELQKQAA